MLLDDLLMQGPGSGDISRDELLRNLVQQISFPENLVYEDVLERVRHFRHAKVLRVASADARGEITLTRISDQLSWIAEAVVNGCLHYLTRQFTEVVPRLAIVAYGKLGGLEMGYGSDLDLVFVHDEDVSAKPFNYVDMVRLTQRLIQMLTLRTVSGRLYDVDTRLRPYGASGPIVTNAAYFEEYYLNKAWTWEQQALVRARGIAGSPLLLRRIEKVRCASLCRHRDRE